MYNDISKHIHEAVDKLVFGLNNDDDNANPNEETLDDVIQTTLEDHNDYTAESLEFEYDADDYVEEQHAEVTYDNIVDIKKEISQLNQRITQTSHNIASSAGGYNEENIKRIVAETTPAGGNKPTGYASYTPLSDNWIETTTIGPALKSVYQNGKIDVDMLGDTGLTSWHTLITPSSDFDYVFRGSFNFDGSSYTGIQFYAGNLSAPTKPIISVGYLFGNKLAKQQWSNLVFNNETIKTSANVPMFYDTAYWRIQRLDNEINYYMSNNGLNWILIHTEVVSAVLNDVDSVGFFVNSHIMPNNKHIGAVISGFDNGPQPEMMV